MNLGLFIILAVAVEQLDWGSYIERVGFPMGALVGLGFFAWRCFKFFGPKITEWVERWVIAHEERSRAATVATEKSVEIQNSNAVTLRSLAATLQSMDRKTAGFVCRFAQHGTPPAPPRTPKHIELEEGGE